MAITASLVKELRERTGSGMMECKKALVETDGDMDAAIELMRKSGQAKADKKAGRIAAEGAIKLTMSADGKTAAMVEINSETDFVAKDDSFQDFTNTVADAVLASASIDNAALAAAAIPSGGTVEEARNALIAKVGENIQIRRFVRVDAANGIAATYLHGGRIGVLIHLSAGDEALARDIAMHIAAIKPQFITSDDIPADVVAKEKDILVAQAESSGKPAEIIEKMVQGRLKKYLSEMTLVGQPFVKDPDTTVGKLLDQANASVLAFHRFEVGEGIEKKVEDFAQEVMAQVKGS